MELHFERVAIVNRGEPAMRFIHAAAEYRRERQVPLRTIALYTEPDRNALFVRSADEAVGLGPATYEDDGVRRSSYLDLARLEAALSAAGADAAWVGWGFVAERPEFADLCKRLGIVFIGPGAEVMRRLGDKITSKLIAEQADVPVAPWSGGAVDNLEEAWAHAERLGFPLMIKATAGGGGRGIRRVADADRLVDAFQSARAEAAASFGDDTVFMETLLAGARHIEVQVIGDAYGTVWPLGVRDCSIQRRNQKILEESPSPALGPDEERSVLDAAARLAGAAGYENAGTVEFLYDESNGRFSFLEVNARLQVEHPVTELTTGLDLVKLQMYVAGGGRLLGDPPRPQGHAIEVRLNAEDPDNGFAPAPGRIELFRFPTGPGIRIDTGFEEGDGVAGDFDSMIAKIIAHGQTRQEALARLHRVLADGSVVIDGGATNRGFLLELVGRPDLATGAVHIGWLDGLVAKGEHVSHLHGDLALIEAAIETYGRELNLERAQFFGTAARGRPEVKAEVGRLVELGHRGHGYRLMVRRLAADRYRLAVDGVTVDCRIERLPRSERRLTVAGEGHHVLSVPQGPSSLVEVDGVSHRVLHDTGGAVRAPAPAVVVSVDVSEGDAVVAGQRLVSLEAMKMELGVHADVDGTVKAVLVMPNAQVGAGDPLVLVEAASDGAMTAAGERVGFAALATDVEGDADSRACYLQALEGLRSLMLGYDQLPGEVRGLAADLVRHGPAVQVGDRDARALEHEILSIFVDVQALFRRRPSGGYEDAGGMGAEEYLFTYLRAPDRPSPDLPQAFLDHLQTTLRHYRVDGLDLDPVLQESLFRIYRSYQRTGEQTGPVLAILDRYLTLGAGMVPWPGEDFRALLDRVVREAQGRAPAVHDAAREVRYRFFEQPLLAQAMEQVYADAAAVRDRLIADPTGPDRDAHIKNLVDCSQPLHGLLVGGRAELTRDARLALLEAMTRRYYRIRSLHDFETLELGTLAFAAAEYDFEGTRIHVLTSQVAYGDFATAAELQQSMLPPYPPEDDVVMDFYLDDGPTAEPDTLRDELLAVLNTDRFPSGLRRVVVAIARDGDASGSVDYFTFRPDGDSYYEEVLYRGLHPMMGKRLELWRVAANFDTERLPSVPDVYLFRAVGKENPRDERLVALAEVRDLTPVRDAEGRVVGLPQLERKFLEALAGIRRFQSHRDTRQRLHWNRVTLYAWPPFDLKAGELRPLLEKLMPETAGLGLEKVTLRVRIPAPGGEELVDRAFEVTETGGGGLSVRFRSGTLAPLKPLDEYTRKVVRLRQRGLMYPYELIRLLAPDSEEEFQILFPPGDFVEHDLGPAGNLVPVDRPYGQNEANVVVGVVRNFTDKHPEGMARVLLAGDPSAGMGSLAEAECRRIIAALDLAEDLGVPLEWFAVSAGAKISMDSGTENMDWIGAVLRRLVEFTQADGEVNVIVHGINVGAQPYWNAEATMLNHTRGILVMTPEGAMVLTGKRALDYSGGVSAEDDQGIGGFERIMGPNGQAQYSAKDTADACRILLDHYEHTYVAPGERFPRRAATVDPADRDVRTFPHGDGDHGFVTVGDVFSDEANPERKKPFEIRKVMASVVDQDHPPLERWRAMRDAEIAVVWDAHLGGRPVCLLGIESRPIARLASAPADGPDSWTAGTLFPMSSKKIARALNAASGNRPVVVLANLSGFDGSPESMRNRQLEYGAEIGRAVVNFDGPIVFCVVSRYHGGAFVVFSKALSENMEVAALEGTRASVIGGAPAAAVVFTRDVAKRTNRDPRVRALEERIEAADPADRPALRAELARLREEVHSEKLGQIADEFDLIHSVERARDVGSVDIIVPPGQLRPYLIDAVERGIVKALEG